MRARRKLAAFVVVFLIVGVSIIAVLLSRTPSSGGAASVLLSEVRFLPKPGDSQFVELKNAGTASLGLPGLVLANTSGATYVLPAGSAALVPGGFALILFDGQRRVDGTTVHADPTDFLDRDAGNLTVRSPAGVVLDHVGWGPGQPDGVRLGRGGKVLPLVAGATIGRFPLSVTPSYRFDWDVFDPDLVTPGAANPIPAVAFVGPLDAAVVNVSAVPLWWYPPAGAVRYRLQLGSDPSLASPLVDKIVRGHSMTTDPLAPGRYFWRVQALESDGSASAFFPVSSFVLLQGRGLGRGADPPRATNETILSVPVFQSRKDTSLLLLEAQQTGANPWDAPHSGADSDNPADYMNCAFASISMVSHALGGDFSQDRLSFSVYRDRYKGPVDDFQFGDGLLDRDQPNVMYLAFGDVGLHVSVFTPDEMWLDVTGELGAGRPILLDVGKNVASHEVVIAGFRDDGGNRSTKINEPGSGTSYWLPFDTSPSGYNASFGWRYQAYWKLVAFGENLTIGKQEASIITDSDQDGMMDFDETERFHTQVSSTDSDRDGIGDKVEVTASVFDPQHGYQRLTNWVFLVAWSNETLVFDPDAFDFDHDKKPMWLDPDSDNGGCTDGREDSNHDGVRDSGETSNFDPNDDGSCFSKGTGSVQMTATASISSGAWTGNGVGALAIDFRVTNVTYEYDYKGRPPVPNATYNWTVRYVVTGNISVRVDAMQTGPNETIQTTGSCTVATRGTVWLVYETSDHVVRVNPTFYVNGPCDFTEVDHRYSVPPRWFNTTIHQYPSSEVAFFSSWAIERFQGTCRDRLGNTHYLCPVSFSGGVASIRDSGPVAVGWFNWFLYSSHFDQAAWQFGLTFNVGNP